VTRYLSFENSYLRNTADGDCCRLSFVSGFTGLLNIHHCSVLVHSYPVEESKRTKTHTLRSNHVGKEGGCNCSCRSCHLRTRYARLYEEIGAPHASRRRVSQRMEGIRLKFTQCIRSATFHITRVSLCMEDIRSKGLPMHRKRRLNISGGSPNACRGRPLHISKVETES
jgi:hypothetical protein